VRSWNPSTRIVFNSLCNGHNFTLMC
jgi:hypothetical protein